VAPAIRSVREEQRRLAASARAEHKAWAEVAAVFCERYGLNVRTALRLVRDWSQRDAAEEWNKRWPDEPKTFKNFSYWEQWPANTGHAPSLEVLGRLAELYECNIADLVSDCTDFRMKDVAYRHGRQLAQLPELVRAESSNGEAEELIARLETMDVQELARLTSSWSERLGASETRRALLLKLSAGLSLAAASPALGDETGSDTSTTLTHHSDTDLAGIWHSRYVYPSTGRKSDFVGEHYLAVRQHGNRLVGQSLPHSSGSRLRIELGSEPPIATGSWRETTSPSGYYKGAVYHGTLQLVIDPSGRCMRGLWLGFDRDFTISSGRWELTWQDGSTAKTIQRRYHKKV
jgi:hypothetical protein